MQTSRADPKLIAQTPGLEASSSRQVSKMIQYNKCCSVFPLRSGLSWGVYGTPMWGVQPCWRRHCLRSVRVLPNPVPTFFELPVEPVSFGLSALALQAPTLHPHSVAPSPTFLTPVAHTWGVLGKLKRHCSHMSSGATGTSVALPAIACVR